MRQVGKRKEMRRKSREQWAMGSMREGSSWPTPLLEAAAATRAGRHLAYQRLNLICSHGVWC